MIRAAVPRTPPYRIILRRPVAALKHRRDGQKERPPLSGRPSFEARLSA
jgi:hypothetical protein